MHVTWHKAGALSGPSPSRLHPGLGLKYLANLSGTFTKASASGGAGFFLVMLGQTCKKGLEVRRQEQVVRPSA